MLHVGCGSAPHPFLILRHARFIVAERSRRLGRIASLHLELLLRLGIFHVCSHSIGKNKSCGRASQWCGDFVSHRARGRRSNNSLKGLERWVITSGLGSPHRVFVGDWWKTYKVFISVGHCLWRQTLLELWILAPEIAKKVYAKSIRTPVPKQCHISLLRDFYFPFVFPRRA